MIRKPPVRMPRPPVKPKSSFPQPTTARSPKSQPSSPSVNRPPRPPPSVVHPGLGHVRYGVSIAFFSFCAAVFIRDHFITFDTVNGSSMSPTLSPYEHETGQKDRIVIRRYLRFGSHIQRGDVITFWKPHKPNEISIKRVVAIEGDTVYPHRGYALDPEMVRAKRIDGWDGLPVRDPDAIKGDEMEVGKVVVPRGHVWVEGDNWRKSYDSCDFGPVSLGLLDGRAVAVWRRWFGFDGVGDGRKREEGHWTRVVEGQHRPRCVDDADMV